MFSTFLQLPVVQNLNYLNKFKMCTHQKDFDFLIPITLGMSWVDVINNFKGWLTVLCRNKALRLDKTRHNSNNSQSECFILTYLPSVVILHTYANICRGNWMRNFQNDFTEFSEILANIFNYRGSVNFYMFFGGTNFGFMSGANHITTNNIMVFPFYAPDVTSYGEASKNLLKTNTVKETAARRPTLKKVLAKLVKVVNAEKLVFPLY